ncbi:MAG: cell division topological specificity factor MinE [Lachnospiraceae bacterium]|nr:cell division topological specificity factor MinE [Lachnospiraceae bacterium]
MQFRNFFQKKSSGDLAKDRLKLLLVSDRVNCSPEVVEMIRDDMIRVISRYVEIDTEGLDIRIIQTGTSEGERSEPALVANIPIQSVKYGNRQTI